MPIGTLCQVAGWRPVWCFKSASDPRHDPTARRHEFSRVTLGMEEKLSEGGRVSTVGGVSRGGRYGA